MPDSTLLGAIAVREIGEDAAGALAGARSGRIAAVFTRSVYLSTAAGWACLGSPELGSGPLNLLCALPDALDWRAGGLRPKAEVGIGGKAIHLGPGLVLSLTGARIWRPDASEPWTLATLRRGLRALDELGAPAPPAGGLGPFLQVPARPVGIEARQAEPAVEALRRWLERDAALAGDLPDDTGGAVERLLGLGSGLTPAGDDFLGGAMIALRRIGLDAGSEALWRRLEPKIAERTVAVSGAHLRAAAAGRGSAALHELLNALVTGRADALPEALTRIDRIGHTSGWDALAGAVTTLRAIANRPESRD